MNKIVVIGGDHHNGLNLVRMFGISGYSVDAFVVTEHRTSVVGASKYVNKAYMYNTEKEAYDAILSIYANSIEKTILIPYSDGAEKELDSRLDEFKNTFIVPSINEEQGRIAALMDKQTQYEWATSKGIKMAPSAIFDLRDCSLVNSWNVFPCILKPVVSAEGDKNDITICYDRKSLDGALLKFKAKGYGKILVQAYLKVDYEIDVFGCICKNEPRIYLVPTKTIRAWPLKTGTNCFSQILTDAEMITKCKNIITVLQNEGFYGLYDIELLVINDEVYLNEINFRNSGDDYMVLSQKFYYPVIWVNDVLGIKQTVEIDHMPKATFAMTFWYDYQHVKVKDISLMQWLADVKKTSDFAFKFAGDNKPTVKYYLRCMINRVKRIMKRV